MEIILGTFLWPVMMYKRNMSFDVLQKIQNFQLVKRGMLLFTQAPKPDPAADLPEVESTNRETDSQLDEIHTLYIQEAVRSSLLMNSGLAESLHLMVCSEHIKAVSGSILSTAGMKAQCEGELGGGCAEWWAACRLTCIS